MGGDGLEDELAIKDRFSITNKIITPHKMFSM